MGWTRVRNCLAALLVVVLAACGGGGGDAGTPSLGGGSGSGGGTGSGAAGPTVTLAISSPTVTPVNSAVLTVSARDAKGMPIAGRVVDLKMSRGGLAALSVSSVATGSDGSASVGVFALTAGASGADEIVATLVLDTTTITGRVALTVAGSAPTLSAVASSVNLRQSDGPVTLSATIRDATGAPATNVLVGFASAGGQVKLGAASALTDASGIARVTAVPSNPAVSVADTIAVTASLQGVSLQSSVPVQVLADEPTVDVTASTNTISAASPATVTVTVVNAKKSPPAPGTLVEVKSQFGLTSFDAATVATDTSGKARIQVSPRSASSNGADQIVVTTSVDGVTVTKTLTVQVSASGSGQPSLSVSVNPGVVTADGSARAEIVLRDARGAGIAGKVIDLTTLRGNLASVDRASVVTNARGEAEVRLAKRPGGPFGADDLVASATVDGVLIKGEGAFTVEGSSPVITSSLSGGGALSGTGDVRQFSATLVGLNGTPVANARVVFATQGNLLKLSANAAVTDSNGRATISVSPADGALGGVESLTVSAVVGGLTAADTRPIQVLAETPRVALTSAPSNQISAPQPGTLRATVLDTQGNGVSGVIVAFSSVNGHTSFSSTTAVTDASGVASVIASPKTGSTGGADEVLASASVRGVAARGTVVLQVNTATTAASPQLAISLLSSQVSSVAPTTVTATLTDGRGAAVAGQVITFTVVRRLAQTNVGTALTDAAGRATVVLRPVSSTIAGADEVTAAVTYAGEILQATRGFEVQAANASLTSLTPLPATIGAYGQATLRIAIAGAAAGSPVNIALTSTCQGINKAVISPSSFTATTPTVDVQYKDNGCGSTQSRDTVRAEIVGSSASVIQDIALTAPTSNSIAFVSASPEVIFIKGSGFTETSTVVFEVRDTAGNVIPNKKVWLRLLTESGGVTIQGATRNGAWLEKSENSDASGRVSVLINAGTQPVPIRIQAYLDENNSIATVSSNLGVGVGLPSQLNFSLSQASFNIEGFNVDGVANTYVVIAADRSGNPVAAGTSINFVTEGGQIEAIRRTSVINGIARAQAEFVSSNPRPVDGRATITAYALGEESFLDLNGNNIYDTSPPEPFQELGRIHKDRDFNGTYDAAVDEYVPTGLDDRSACNLSSAGVNPVHQALLRLDATIPSTSVGDTVTCDGVWSGAGKVYVRRAVETILSTSSSRLLWADTATLDGTCRPILLQTGPDPLLNIGRYVAVNTGQTVYMSASSLSDPAAVSLQLYIADANTYPINHPLGSGGALGRLNPMAAGSTISVSTNSPGVTATVLGGGTVPSTTSPSIGLVGVSMDGSTQRGLVVVTARSPSGVSTSYALTVEKGTPASVCPF